MRYAFRKRVGKITGSPIFGVIGNDQVKQLPNSIADRLSRDSNLRLDPTSRTMLLQPVFNKGFNVSGEFIPAACPGCVRELAEPYQDRYAGEHVAGRIVVFSQPGDIAL